MSLAALDRSIEKIMSLAQWLILPVVVLLFLQWPLRDLFRAYSREANDFGQWMFAIYVAVSFSAATRARAHLAADAIAKMYSEKVRDTIFRLGAALGVLPWALLALI